MAKVELNIVALGDFASVSTQIKNLQTQIVALQKNLASVGVSSTLSKDLAAINASFKQTMLSTGQFTESTVKMSSETEKFGQALVNGKLKLSQYYDIIKQRSSESLTQMKALALEQTKLQNSLIVNDPTKQGILSVYTPTQIDKVANATKIAANEANLYAIAVNKGSQELINFGKNTQWAGRQLTVGMSVPLIIFGQQATQAFKDVNVELTRLQRLYGEGLKPPSQTEINQISAQVTDLGKNVASSMGIAVKDTVQVAANFAAMGRQGQNLLDTTYQTQRLSKLGAVDATAATNTVVALQNVYKVSTTQLADAVNFLSDIQKQTTMTLGDMTEAIPRVGPIMQQLGGSYKDTAVMLVAMREAGIPAAQAANAVKSAIASLIAPTKGAVSAAQQFGISLDAVKNAGSPVQMIEKLQEGLKGLSPLAKEQVIDKIFGKFQFARVSALLANFGQIGSQTQNALKIAGATSAELANLANQEMKQATESTTAKYQRSIETFKADLIPVGQELLKIATKLMDFGNAVAKVFSGLPGPLKTVMGAIAIGVALSGPVIMLTGLLANFAGYVMRGVFNLKQLATGGKTLGQLLTPELIAAQNASQIFNSDILTSVSSVELLSKAIGTLTASIESMVSSMNVGTGLSSVLNTVGAVAATEVKTYEQMHLPGFASGGIVPGMGSGKVDTFPAMLAPGEAVIDSETTKKYLPWIKAMVSGKLMGYANNNIGSLAHASGSIDLTSPEAMAYFAEHPGQQAFANKYPEKFKLLGSLTSRLPQSVNRNMDRGTLADGTLVGESKDNFEAGWNATSRPVSHFAEAAAKGGMSIDKMATAESQQAQKKFDDEVLARVLALKKGTGQANESYIQDQEYYKVVHEVIQDHKKLGGASTEFASALETAAKTTGGFRTSFATVTQTEKEVIQQMQATGELIQKEGAKTALAFQGESVAQITHRGVVRGYSNPGYKPTASQQEAINKIGYAEGVSTGENVVSGFKSGTGSHSPSVKAEQTMLDFGKGVDLGGAKIIPQVEKVGTQIGEAISKTTAESIASSTPAVSEAVIAQTEEAASVAQSRMSIIASKLKGKAALGGGMGAMMAGQMLSGQGGILGAAGGAMSNAGMASMAMPGIAAGAEALGFAVPGLGEVMATVAALTLAYKGVNQIIKGEQAAQAQAAATFSSSSEMATFFGGVLQDTSSHLDNIALSYDSITSSAKQAATTMGVSNTQIASFVNMAKSLPKDNPVSVIMDKLKNTSGKSAGEFAKAFIDMQVAIGNIDPKKAQQALDLLLASSGNSDQIGKTSAATSQAGAVTSAIKSAQKIGGGGSGILAHTFNDILGFVAAGPGGVADAESRRRQGKQENIDKATSSAIADPLNSALNSHSLDRIKQVVDGINAAGLGASRSLNIFKNSLTAAADQRKVEILKSYGLNLEQIAKILSYLQAGQNIDLTKGIGGIDFKKIDEFLKNWKDPATTSPAITAATAIGNNLQKQVDANKAEIRALEAKKKVIDAELKAQRDISTEMQRQHDYTVSQIDLQNKQKDSLIHGDYLTAATLGQQKDYATMQFNQQTKAVGLQGQSDLLAQKIADLNDKQTILSDAINNNSTKVQNLTTALQNNPPVQKPLGDFKVPMLGAFGANTTSSLTQAYKNDPKLKPALGGLLNPGLDPSLWNSPGVGGLIGGASARSQIKKYAADMGYKPSTATSNTLFEIDHNKLAYIFKVLKDGNVQMEGQGKVGQIWDPKTGKFVSPSVNIPTPSVKPNASISASTGNSITAATGSTVNSVTIQVSGTNMDAQTVANTVFDKVKTHLAVSGAKVNSTNKVKP